MRRFSSEWEGDMAHRRERSKFDLPQLVYLHRFGMMLLLLIAASPLRTAFANVCSVPTFSAARLLNPGAEANFVAVGDFNGDGKPDLAVADNGSWGDPRQTYTNSGVSVLLGKGDGTLQAGVSTPRAIWA